MVKIILFALGSFGFTLILAPFIIDLLYRYQIRETIRKEGPPGHLVKEGTPTMAGILIVIAVAFINLLFNLSRSETYLPIFALAASGLMGVLEDASKIYRKSLFLKILRKVNGAARTEAGKSFLKRILFFPWSAFKELFRSLGSKEENGLRSYQKFLLQLILAAFLGFWFYFKLGWSTIWLPLSGNVDVSFAYPLVIVLIFLVFINAVGITDGLDGLAGGLLCLLFGSLGFIAIVQNQLGLALFSATVVGSLLAFLYFNFYPARVFMGNVGSHALGAAAAVVAVLLHKEIILLLLGGVFILELLSVIVQVFSVKLYRRRFFKMAPGHHHFELLGWPEVKVTLRFWLAGVVFSLLGILFSQF